MKLTKSERLALYNQYRILEKLYPDETEDFQKFKTIVQDGYEYEYEDLVRHLYDGLSTEECNEVIEIMEMFSVLKRSYDELEDKSGVDDYKISFHGFSGNEENLQMAYARFLQKDDRFTDLKTNDRCNSHFPTLRGNRKMLEEWYKSENKYELSKEDIIRIQKNFEIN